MSQRSRHISVFVALLALLGAVIVVTLDLPESRVPKSRAMILDPISFPKALFVGEDSWGRRGVASWEAIDDGHRLRESGDEIGAITHWKLLAIRYEETDIVAACAALENVATCCSNLRERSKAITVYKQIVEVGDRAGMNTAYYACKQLSDLYIECGNADESLRFARMAQSQFPFSSICGNASLGEMLMVNQRVTELSMAKSTQSSVALKKQITLR